ncbi:unnamed protein product [Urochloa decumbens]|uniref:Uncharacterized protein n=1 Tax=Urochloa decumbens TaxID=240449 RepID=A0ABC9EHT0_9POAL
MANHLKCSLIQCLLLLLSCAATKAAGLDRLEYHKDVSYQPQLQDFPNERLYRSYFIIQRFRNTITCDPKNITATWAGHDICGDTNYRGFYCTALHGQAEELAVTAVVFNGFGLCAPKLQGFVDALPDVALFQASSNNFDGKIPRLNGLPYQYKLNVRKDVQGHLPYDEAKYPLIMGMLNLGDIIKIKLMVSRSGLRKREGRMPGSTSARALLLNNNNLSGPLPASISLSQLSYLALANNKLTGPIPSSISHLQDSLFEVLLLNNQLSGCLPHELGMLHKATVIDAGKNQLTGPILASFSCLASVEQLNLGENRLYGQVPDALCKLAAGPAGRLANLTLSGNYFTSVGPACAALIKDGVLDVKNNCIPGLAGQRKPAECAAFQSQPKTACTAAESAQVACPAGAATGAAVAPGERKVREYSSYVTYATLHE